MLIFGGALRGVSARLGAIALVIGLIVGAAPFCEAASAQGAEAVSVRHVPASMSAKDYEAMLNDIADTVVRRLGSTPGQPPVPPAQQARGAGVARMGVEGDAFKGLAQLEDRAAEVVSALPKLDDSLEQVLARLGRDDLGGFGPFLLKILLGILIAIGAEKTARAVITHIVRQQVHAEGEAHQVLSRTVSRALLDAVPLIPFVIVLYLFSAHGFAGNSLQQKAAHIIFSAVLIWRVAVLVPLIWFRPEEPSLRIAAVDDRDAKRGYHALFGASLAYVLVQAIFDVLIAVNPPDEVIITAGFFNNLLFSVIDYTTIFVTLGATARWLTSLINNNGGVAATVKLRLAKYWWALAILADTIMTLALAYGMLAGNQDVGDAVVTSLTLTLALIFLEALYDYIQRPAQRPAADGTASGRDAGEMRSIDLVARCLRFVTRLLIAAVVFEIWIFDVLSLVAAEDAPSTRAAIRDIFLTISVAYLVWQIACFHIGRQLAETATANGSALGRSATMGSRLHTMLPLARLALGITIAVLAVLSVLSRLGVNTAPLIAGASVLGLAVSFGSQTLVKDVISGFFYLVDDAFRVGEYIQSGNYRGVVESFSLRSVKLRHQNGPLFTVPFGVLGAIQNMSRDWAIEKINVGVTYDTDIDKARKIVKKVGQELKADPELADGMLEPLKMQGVQAFGDFAIQLRMKMMTRPGDVQFLARRRALALIKKAFDANGINFAYPTVQVAGLGADASSQAANAAIAEKGLEFVKQKAAG